VTLDGVVQRASQLGELVYPPDQQPVAGRLAHQDLGRSPGAAVGFEQTSQVRDVRLQGRDRLRRRFLTPHFVDEVLERDDGVRGQQQDAQDRTLLRATQIEWSPVDRRLERSENPELHLPSPSPPVEAVATR
jgi:hypothetical protein